jgi:hypothetical protein
MTVLQFSCNGQVFQVHMPDHHKSHEWRNGVPPSDAVTFHPRAFSLMRGIVVTGSVLIKISPFYYIKDGEFRVFPETTLNTTPYLATTANKVRLAVVGFNITTELIEVYTGAEIIFSAITPPPLPTGMPSGFFPSFLVRLRYNTLELFETDITDARFALMESAGGSGSNAWPLAGQNLLEGTNYSTATLLIAAMTSGDIGYLGSRASAETVDVNEAGITLQGVGREPTIFNASFLVSGNDIRIEDIGVVVDSVGTAAIRTTGGPVDFVDVRAEHTNVANTRGFQLEADARLYDCEGIATSTGTTARAVYATNNSVVEVHGGYYSASGGTADEIFADGGSTILLNGPTLAFGNLGGAGDISGWWVDIQGNVHFVADTKLILGDGATEAPLNITERNAEPSSPDQEDIYLDDGTNTSSGSPSFRRYDGAAWEDIGGGGSGGGTITIKNTSGATANANEVGYIDNAGEYKTTTTANLIATWCVVVVGGANNTDIQVTRHGRVTVKYAGTDPSAGQFLTTNTTAGLAQRRTVMHPAIFAVCTAAGSSGLVEALLLTGRELRTATDSHFIYGIESGSDSDFTSTIATLPGGAVLTYGAVTTGNENTIAPWAALDGSDFNAKCVLWNLTRGTSALISSVVVGTNTITLTATVPVGWTVGDTITARGQTNTQNWSGGAYYFEWDMSGWAAKPALATAIVIEASLSDTSTTVPALSSIHPFETFAASKNFQRWSQAGNSASARYLASVTVPIFENKFTFGWDASGSGTAQMFAQLAGWVIAVP